jgi:hypothetical protein
MSIKTLKFSVLVGTLVVLCGVAAETNAQEPGWDSRIIVPREERAALQATPIEQRSYRPFHFYGNTVRRSYYRGNPLPLPRDYMATGNVLNSNASPTEARSGSISRNRRGQ